MVYRSSRFNTCVSEILTYWAKRNLRSNWQVTTVSPSPYDVCFAGGQGEPHLAARVLAIARNNLAAAYQAAARGPG